MSDGKLVGTCSVCLRPMQLHGDRPIRHGFSAIGVRHGAHSGYHTGPCQGTRFPHLGISDAGTKWAIDDARAKLSGVEKRLAELATRAVVLEDRARPHLREISGLWGRGTKGTRGGEKKPGSWREYLAEHAPEVLPENVLSNDITKEVA